MGKRRVLLITVAVTVVLLAVIAALIVIALNTAHPFSLQEPHYQRIMQEFASDRIAAPVDSVKEAKQVAQEIWCEIYGTDEILDEKPYVVYYDEAEEVWLVTGTMLPFALGGVAKILIHKDGAVLAVWHEK